MPVTDWGCLGALLGVVAGAGAVLLALLPDTLLDFGAGVSFFLSLPPLPNMPLDFGAGASFFLSLPPLLPNMPFGFAAGVSVLPLFVGGAASFLFGSVFLSVVPAHAGLLSPLAGEFVVLALVLVDGVFFNAVPAHGDALLSSPAVDFVPLFGVVGVFLSSFFTHGAAAGTAVAAAVLPALAGMLLAFAGAGVSVFFG